jgi:hypothetical protein
MKNGLYSVHIQMGDGVKGRASGVIVLRDGVILGGDPYFWSVGSYTVGNGTWKGDLVTNQRQPGAPGLCRPGGHHRLFRHLSRRRLGGIRHLAGGHAKHQFSRDFAPFGG